jgi:putative transposase
MLSVGGASGIREILILAAVLVRFPENAWMGGQLGTVKGTWRETCRSVSWHFRMTQGSSFWRSLPSLKITRLAPILDARSPRLQGNAEDPRHASGIEISHETLRAWWNRFGARVAAAFRRRRTDWTYPLPPWRRRMDEVFVKISGADETRRRLRTLGSSVFLSGNKPVLIEADPEESVNG